MLRSGQQQQKPFLSNLHLEVSRSSLAVLLYL
jgi:hypothetical protein